MNKIEEAISFALKAHEGAVRKGTRIPYILHPFEAAAIAAQLTTDEDVIAAAVLHDVLEDTSFTGEDLCARFGESVTALVRSSSENKRRDRPANETWVIRKQETLEHLRTASRNEKIVAFADKLSNLRATLNDFLREGERFWERFQQKDPARHLWYYEGVYSACEELSASPLFQEYGQKLQMLHTKVQENIQRKGEVKMKNQFYRPETTNLNAWNAVLEGMRKDLAELTRGKGSEEEVRAYLNDLLTQALPLETDNSLCFFGFDKPENMPSDARVDYFYYPTYLATAITMRALNRYPGILKGARIAGESSMTTEEAAHTLSKVMLACTMRGFSGHGYDDLSGQLDALELFLEADAPRFIAEHPELCPEFNQCFLKVFTNCRTAFEGGATLGELGRRLQCKVF